MNLLTNTPTEQDIQHLDNVRCTDEGSPLSPSPPQSMSSGSITRSPSRSGSGTESTSTSSIRPAKFSSLINGQSKSEKNVTSAEHMRSLLSPAISQGTSFYKELSGSSPDSKPTSKASNQHSQVMTQILQNQLGISNQQLQSLMHQQVSSYQTEQQKELIDVGKKHLEQLLQMNLFHLNPGDQKSSLEQFSHQMNNYQYPGLMAAAQLQLHPRRNHDNTNNNNVTGKQDPKYDVDCERSDVSPSAASKRQFFETGHPLYSHGICRWTGCEAGFTTFEQFKEHLSEDHVLDERSTAQTRVQVQIVSQLEQQLAREKHRLEAMMSHLHPNGERGTKDPLTHLKSNGLAQKSSPINNLRHNKKMSQLNQDFGMPVLGNLSQLEGNFLQGLASNPNFNLQNFMGNSSLPPAFAGLVRSKMGSSTNQVPSMVKHTSDDMEHRTFKDDKATRPAIDLSGEPRASPVRGMSTRSGSGGQMDIESEITKNRDFYRSQDVRPPFTYAALIRQGIIESPDRQLTLNEIYTWFQNTFAYFRRNAATWKNAVRHNLSLHKCFMRVENVKGAVWTVDETEYHRRRPQRGSMGLSKSNGMSRSESPIAATDQDSYPGHHQGIGTSLVHPFNGFSPEQQAYLQGLGMGAFSGVGQSNDMKPKSSNMDYEEDPLEQKREDPERTDSEGQIEPSDQSQKASKSDSASENDNENNDENDNSDSPEDLSSNTRTYHNHRQVRKRFHPYDPSPESSKESIKQEPPSVEN